LLGALMLCPLEIRMKHIAVIGAGITGVTSAYLLLKHGYRVTVIDRHRYPAMETSFANGGQLSASNAEVWNNGATLLKGLKWMLRSDAPLLLNPRPSYHKYSWLAEFCGQVRNYRGNTIETARLAIAARAQLLEMAATEHIDFDLEQRGILHIYHDAPSFAAATSANLLLREAGLDRYPVTPEEMRGIEPALTGALHGGFYTPADATGDIHKFTRGLAAACERLGATFILDATVDHVAASDAAVSIALHVGDDQHADRTILDADAALVCAGVASRKFAAMLGDRINIYPVKGYSITVGLNDPVSQQAAPTVSLLDERAKIVTSRLGRDRFRVAGTAEFNGENRDIRADRIRPLVRWAADLFPEMSTAAVIPWAGLRPMTPNMMPRIGRGRHPRIFYNTGHGHLGWTLSGATAAMAAQAIAGQAMTKP
jgi:D-amino-acid dehydrogenase